MPITEISLATGCLGAGILVTPLSVSAATFLPGGAFVSSVVSVPCACATSGTRRQSAARTRKQMRRRLWAKL